MRQGNLFVSRRTTLRWGAAAAVTASTIGLSSCTAAARAAVFNPATKDWLTELARSIAAIQIEKALDKGLKGIWEAWSENTEETIDEATGGEKHWYSAWAHPVPPVVMISLSATKQGDPMRDRLVACVNEGRQSVVFEAWAWQALSMFLHDLTQDKTGADLAMVRSLCQLTLVPSGVAPKTGGSPAGTVDWMAYQARNGEVEITRIVEPDGSASAIVTAEGIPDADQNPVKKKFTLPTGAAGA